MANFRAVSEADRPEVEKWIADDPGHRGRMTADFFLVPGSHSLYAIEDDEGTVMYVRQEPEAEAKCRMYIQFGPDVKRMMKVFREAFPVVLNDAKLRGFKAFVFDSHSPALVRWLMMEFCFTAECEAAL